MYVFSHYVLFSEAKEECNILFYVAPTIKQGRWSLGRAGARKSLCQQAVGAVLMVMVTVMVNRQQATLF